MGQKKKILSSERTAFVHGKPLFLFLTGRSKHEKLSEAKVRDHVREKYLFEEETSMLKENAGEAVYLIVGLGNPGEKYAGTRHNAGFDTLDRLTRELGVTLRKRLLLQGSIAEKKDGNRKIVLCKPDTFMNRSGECVQRLMKRYRCGTEQLLVIYDDIDLPPGRIRIRKNGGPGTHNGMRSIVDLLGSNDFPRIRIGTGDRPAGQDLADWVLSRCEPEERKTMEAAFDRACTCALSWVREGIDAAMAAGNRKGN